RPSKSAARNAQRRGHVQVDGARVDSSAAAPPAGAVLEVLVGSVDDLAPGLAERAAAWNRGRGGRGESLLGVLRHCPEEGWAVVHKPAGLHTTKVSGPVVVATAVEAHRSICAAFAERTVRKEYRAVVCGSVGAAGDVFTVDAPVDGKESQTEVEVLQTAACPHCGTLSELALRPLQGRRHQLRLHCAEALGAPVVNEDEGIYALAESAWRRRHGAPLPPRARRGVGGLFLQAVAVAFPRPGRPGELAAARAPVAER
ncbi:unnamed protein product, partial [Prorocentrum cordatum]